MQPQPAPGSDFDGSTQISVALSSDALTIDPSEWGAFVKVDFIASSPSEKDSISLNGTSTTSEDITGQYSSEQLSEAYIAASIPFTYFTDNAQTARSSKNSLQYGEFFIKFVIGNGKCPKESNADCQNNALLPGTN